MNAVRSHHVQKMDLASGKEELELQKHIGLR